MPAAKKQKASAAAWGGRGRAKQLESMDWPPKKKHGDFSAATGRPAKAANDKHKSRPAANKQKALAVAWGEQTHSE
jgi:hypothetical protein